MAKQRINRVTTKRGDSGLTSLGDGTEVSKADPRIQAIGSVDELNCFIGVLITHIVIDSEPAQLCHDIQQALFDLGAALSVPGSPQYPDTQIIETAVSSLNATLEPLREFVIPGGTAASAAAHVCRATCRRAERDAWSVPGAEAGASYLNRLSDLFFVLARTLNTDEQQWRGLS